MKKIKLLVLKPEDNLNMIDRYTADMIIKQDPDNPDVYRLVKSKYSAKSFFVQGIHRGS